ncbi:hypothetical protein C8A01DRAFT_36023 [Parachaetomium inaequale]|uniref:Apple domain-containing protein n=1 Tax=Parachaetomium inaequale TaxID=2588326 RepID=A0AAN6PH48_9PEZI|nr:hypothetical protein C8A01DRAFT_36023 [Parachaetomium inaequale]
MDSPIHPNLKPTPRPTPTSSPLPARRNDPLIQGSDIELAPRPFEERLPNPTPEAIELVTPTTRRHFEEHLTNPPPEVLPHSTLELAKPPQSRTYLLPVHQHPDTLHTKAWESGGQHSRPGSGYSHSHTTPTTGPESGPGHGQGQRYSYGDFSSPFDQSPLVPPAAVPPLSGGKGNGNGGKRERICGVRRQWFWAGVAVDYNSNLGTTADMYNTPTDTLRECIDLCAGQDGCVGAGWGHGDTGGTRAICWLKSRLGEANDAPLWSFAVEDLED